MQAKTITIANKLQRQDSNIGLDVWYKHILFNIPYSIQRVETVQGTTTSIGQVFVILIPFDSAYLPYHEWKDGDRDANFTLSQGDVIFIDENVDEEITPSTIVQLRQKYKGRVCEVRSIEEVIKRTGVQYRLKVSGV